jgi:CBS domain-containing protein
MRTDFPILAPDVSVRDALTVMEDVDVDLIPVVDGGAFVGVVTTTEILKLDDILGKTSGEP